jgi:hypothetical protein
MPSVITGTSVSSATALITSISTGSSGTPGTVTGQWTLTTGSTWEATFADLAEYHESDKKYDPGTVVIFGGEKEITISEKMLDTRVAGAISTDPAYIMNAGKSGIQLCLALQGRTPVKVVGQVKKGDILVTSNVPGHAIVNNKPEIGTIIGKSLEDKTSQEKGLVMTAIGRF